MACNSCGSDPVVLSIMDAESYESQALCAACLPDAALALAVNTNPDLIFQDVPDGYALRLPESGNAEWSQLLEAAYDGEPADPTPPAGHGPDASSAGGPSPDDSSGDGSGPGPVIDVREHDGEPLADDDTGAVDVDLAG